MFFLKEELAILKDPNRWNVHIIYAAPQPMEWNTVGTGQHGLSHEEVVWKGALEWCESRGKNLALNPKDKDNTPSYSNFQFKWDTLKLYVVKYSLLPNDLEQSDYTNWTYDYPLVSEIVNRMLGDKDVDFKQEFPDCVRKLGYPPIN